MSPLSGKGLITCMHCGMKFFTSWNWYVCDTCGYRICVSCLASHRGPYGAGHKCSQCQHGRMERA